MARHRFDPSSSEQKVGISTFLPIKHNAFGKRLNIQLEFRINLRADQYDPRARRTEGIVIITIFTYNVNEQDREYMTSNATRRR